MLYESGFWEEMSDYDRAKFQLFEDRLCMPFKVFHAAIESVLGRPVFVHELGSNLLQSEFLGMREPPTLDEIVSLIPEDKRMIVSIHNRNN